MESKLNAIIDIAIIKIQQLEQLSIDRELLFKPCRRRCVVMARYFVWKALDKHTKLTSDAMGAIFNRDHATVLNGLKSIQNIIDTNAEYRSQYFEFELYVKRLLGVDDEFENLGSPLTVGKLKNILFDVDDSMPISDYFSLSVNYSIIVNTGGLHSLKVAFVKK